MIELIANIGDDRRCSITIWKAKDWQALGTASGLPRPSRIQDYLAAGKVVGQSHYFLIEELPRLVAWLENTGRAYRLKKFNEVTTPSSEVVKARAMRQEQAERATEAAAQRALKLAEAGEETGAEKERQL
jgi:hypothetical protein